MSKSHGTWPVQGRAKCAKDNERGQFGTIILRWRKTCQNAKKHLILRTRLKIIERYVMMFLKWQLKWPFAFKGKGKAMTIAWSVSRISILWSHDLKGGMSHLYTYNLYIYIDSMTHLCQWCHSRVQHGTASPATHKSNVKQAHLKYFAILELRRTSTSTSPNRQHFTPATSRNHFT